MAEGEQNKPLDKKLGSVPPFAVAMIIAVIIAGLGVTCFVFFKDKIKSAFSRKDDSNQVSDQITNVDNLKDSVVNELENLESKGIIQNDTTEPAKEETILTLPEEAGKIVRPENER